MRLRVVAFLALAGALAPPALASYDALKPTASQQVDLGKRAATDLRKREKVLPTSDPRVKLVRSIAKKLLATFKDEKPWEYSFDVIQSKQVNAFALPGGPMFIYTGLLDKFKTEDELAGVMGHELIHVRKEHWAYGYRDSMQKQLGLTAILMIFRVNRTGTDIANIATDLVFNLPYSRKHESEADDGGLTMMVQAGYNPTGIIDAFKMLQATGGKSAPPEWLSDHPSDTSRIRKMQDRVTGMHREFPAQKPLDFHSYFGL